MTIALASIWTGEPFFLPADIADGLTGAGIRLIGPKEVSWDSSSSTPEQELQNLMDVPDQPKPTILFM
jgi:hypothetical protein